MKPFLFSILLLLLASSCSQEKPQLIQTLPASGAWDYELTEAPVLPVHLQMQVAATAGPAEQLQLKIVWHNQGKDTLLFDEGAAMLINKAGRRVSPVPEGGTGHLLPPGRKDSLLMTFEPVSNMRLYKVAGIRGRLEKEYFLPVHILTTKDREALLHDTLHFVLKDSLYAAYLQKKEEQEPVQLYTIQATEGQEERLSVRLKQLFGGSGHSGSARILEEELFMAGMNVRIAAYTKGDSLHLRFRIVNHSPAALYVNPKAVGLAQSSLNAQPGARGNLQEPFFIRKGDRVELQKQYKIPEKKDSLWINLQGIQLTDKKTPLLSEPVLFRPWQE